MTQETGGRPHLSVVIPAFNEQVRIGDTLTAVLEYVDANRIRSEVLVIDDGSTDTAGVSSGTWKTGEKATRSVAESSKPAAAGC